MYLQIDMRGYTPVDYQELGYDLDILLMEMEDGSQWILASTFEEAGLAAAIYWETQATENPEAFLQVFEPGAITTWLLAETETFQDWLDNLMGNPQDHWAKATGEEGYVEEVDEDLVQLLGFAPTVAYKWE